VQRDLRQKDVRSARSDGVDRGAGIAAMLRMSRSRASPEVSAIVRRMRSWDSRQLTLGDPLERHTCGMSALSQLASECSSGDVGTFRDVRDAEELDVSHAACTAGARYVTRPRAHGT
jgi:hypothetical protein